MEVQDDRGAVDGGDNGDTMMDAEADGGVTTPAATAAAAAASSQDAATQQGDDAAEVEGDGGVGNVKVLLLCRLPCSAPPHNHLTPVINAVTRLSFAACFKAPAHRSSQCQRHDPTTRSVTPLSKSSHTPSSHSGQTK